MRIALPITDGRVSAHFGHARQFALVDTDLDCADLTITRLVTPPPHAPGVLPRWLAEQGVQVVIGGGIGPRAVELLAAQGIECQLGVPDLSLDDAIARFRAGSLPTGEVDCTHAPGHTCQH